MWISRNIRMQVRAEQNQGRQMSFSKYTCKKTTTHRRSLVAINKAPNTHNEILLGAEENTSGANVKRRIHQQRSCSTEPEKSWEGEAKGTQRSLGYWIKLLS